MARVGASASGPLAESKGAPFSQLMGFVERSQRFLAQWPAQLPRKEKVGVECITTSSIKVLASNATTSRADQT